MSTNFNAFNVDAFGDTIGQLLGESRVAFLPLACTQASKAGEFVAFDSLGGSGMDDATATLIASLSNGETDRSPANIADLLATMTPNLDPNRQRSQVGMQKIEWGTVITKDATDFSPTDPQSAEIIAATNKVNKQRNSIVRTALGAASVTRGRTSGSTSNVSMPSSQKYTIDATGNTALFSLDDIAYAKAKLEENYAGDEFFMAIPPYLWYALVKNDGAMVGSTDYVPSTYNFASGNIGKVYGCTIIVDPGISSPESSDPVLYAWAKSAMVYNVAVKLRVNVGIDPSMKFDRRLYIEESVGAVRVDDLGCLQITYNTAYTP